MQARRNGNMGVDRMVREIKTDLKILKECYMTERRQRQLLDGTKFLEMIEKPPYCSCATVNELKEELSFAREQLKIELVDLEKDMPGHQFSLFEIANPLTDEQIKEVNKRKVELDEQIQWLHKCLGMCLNPNYFR